jgi:hypothetical protein
VSFRGMHAWILRLGTRASTTYIACRNLLGPVQS